MSSKRTPVPVSVIIPSYNMGEYIVGAVQSVLQEELPDAEVLVMDDGSTDDTLALLEPFTDDSHPSYDPRVRVYSHSNRGKPATVNRAFGLARGSYIAIVDADDRMPENGLRARYDAAQHHGGTDLVIGACEVFRGQDTLHVWGTPSTDGPAELRRGFYLRPRQPFHLNACLLSRTLVERTGPINENRPRCEDIDYALRLLNEVRTIRLVDQVVYQYRKYRGSLVERLELRVSTLLHRLGVMNDNLHGMERLVGMVASLSFDTLKLLYEAFVGAYPKRMAS